jgi:hypothetical protein
MLELLTFSMKIYHDEHENLRIRNRKGSHLAALFPNFRVPSSTSPIQLMAPVKLLNFFNRVLWSFTGPLSSGERLLFEDDGADEVEDEEV